MDHPYKRGDAIRQKITEMDSPFVFVMLEDLSPFQDLLVWIQDPMTEKFLNFFMQGDINSTFSAQGFAKRQKTKIPEEQMLIQ